MIYPISFSIPSEKIVKNVPYKEKTFAYLIPGNSKTYIFDSEEEYYKDYQKSVFGYTWKKAGFDCLRHYEILANGCIPYFPDLDQFPPSIMSTFPKEIVKSAMQQISVNNPNPSLVQSFTEKLLDYTRHHLTTRASALRMLSLSNLPHIKSVLFLSGDTQPDYMRCLTLHGFKSLFKSACHDFPKIPHLYTDFSHHNASQLYGNGFTYTRLLDPSIFRNSDLDAHLEDLIQQHHFDIVIYGSVHRGMPFIELVRSVYTTNEILGICGEDHYNETCPFIQKPPCQHFFLREFSISS